MSAAPRAPLSARLPLWLGIAAACGGTGCVHVYEPLSGLHRTIVIDTDVANFTGVTLDIFCPPGGQLGRSEADELATGEVDGVVGGVVGGTGDETSAPTECPSSP